MGCKVIFDITMREKKNSYLPEFSCGYALPEKFKRKELCLPELGELDVIRHYNKLSNKNFSVDTHFYPLGSCTMKYNPKINDYIAGLENFSALHPLQPIDDVQGILEVLYTFQELLCSLTGMSAFTFQPSSGAQGELTGMLIARKFHELNGRRPSKVIVPDTAHGTNPASAAMAGFDTVIVKSNDNGLVDINSLKDIMDESVAAIMLTNPNTLGLFEKDILKIRELADKAGALMYYDGANFNALMGVTTPRMMGFDIIHLNLHKSFSTPHGCGGPGAGVVGVTEKLKDFLPVPIVVKDSGRYRLNYDMKKSVGKLRAFYGNISVLLRAYTYILRLGGDGVKRVSENAVLNANYIKEKLKDDFKAPYDDICMHEVVFSCINQKEKGITALDIAKRLIDRGIHPPTMYFPLLVKEALMVEPTETESKETLDYFIDIMRKINSEVETNPSIIKNAPVTMPVKRVDEVRAVRDMDFRWHKDGD
ncbi:MAG: aminomethyl-transferring glycine dehydrogenase subunit GcvPB [Candidatus Omnitrophica bacterium]|nr:aminomethyl-transferring glycine dehydrogenase subunit GcvPB [Candidatus Omnitrophota bacterium]MDD5440860.1 aminomethyl-transferring glycine dehydrogenase subunit GcvPB [Candidatus Omnitrophota bacterium]